MSVTNVSVIQVVTLLRELGAVYRDAFAGLNARTPQRHLMNPHEFRNMMLQPGIEKFIHRNSSGQVNGLSTYTNCIDAAHAPLLSDDFLAYRYPEEFAQDKVWAVLFVAVAPAARLSGVDRALIKAMQAHSGPDAITIIDTCDQRTALAAGTARILAETDPSVRLETLGSQTYHAIRFGE